MPSEDLKVHRDSNSQVGAHLGVWGFIPLHPPTLLGACNVTHGFHFWPAPLQALTLVASPRLRLQQLMLLSMSGFTINMHPITRMRRFTQGEKMNRSLTWFNLELMQAQKKS